MKKINISVIMSEYDTKPEYLREAIHSILSQTFTDFEFIIIDDSGKSKVGKFVESYKDNRIRIIDNKKNRGLIYSLNKGLRQAKGVYIVRMDTDDIALPSRIEVLYDFIRNNPEYSVVGSRVVEFSEQGDTAVLGTAGEKTAKSIMRGEPLVHPSVIMLRDAVLQVGGYPNYKRAEDLALWCELLLNGSKMYVVGDTLLRYRVNRNDYGKRTIRHRKGEITARLHYYPKLGAGPLEYFRIGKSIVAGLLPVGLTRAYRNKFIVEMDRD